MWDIFFPQLIWMPALLGLGWGVEKLVFRSTTDFGEQGMLAILLLAIFAAWSNFIMPLKHLPIFFIGIGWCLWFFQLRSRPNLRKLLALFLLILAASISTFHNEPVYDTGQYHVPASLWAFEKILPLGLANINEFIAYNSLWFPTTAMLEAPGFHLRGIFLAETMALVFFCYLLGQKVVQEKQRILRFFALGCLILLMWLGMFSWGGTTSSDAASLMFSFTALYFWLEASGSDDKRPWFLAVAFSVFSVCIKLSAIPIFIGVVLHLLVRTHRNQKALLAKGALLASAFLLPWLARGIFTSGCLAYPATASCFSKLPWTPPLEDVRKMTADISHSAGGCFIAMGDLSRKECLSTWGKDLVQSRTGLSFLFLVLLACLLNLSQLKKTSPDNGEETSSRWPLAFCLMGISFWFVTAPTSRFGLNFLFGFAILFLFRSLAPSRIDVALLRRYPWVFLFLCLLWMKREVFHFQNHPLAWSGFPTLRMVSVEPRRSENGETYYTSPERVCWNSVMPCATAPVENLIIERGIGGRYSFSRKTPSSKFSKTDHPSMLESRGAFIGNPFSPAF